MARSKKASKTNKLNNITIEKSDRVTINVKSKNDDNGEEEEFVN